MADALFHPEAQAEYTDAIRWYEDRSVRAASRFEDEVEQLLKRIIDEPEMFPRYDDEHRFALLRRFPYSVFIRFTGRACT